MSRFWTLGVVMAALFVGGCTEGSMAQPDAAATPDAMADAAPPGLPDDGFGATCAVTNESPSGCTSLYGVPGWCVADFLPPNPLEVQSPWTPRTPDRLACRRRCSGHYAGCPAHQAAVPITGDQCYCLPPYHRVAK